MGRTKRPEWLVVSRISSPGTIAATNYEHWLVADTEEAWEETDVTAPDFDPLQDEIARAGDDWCPLLIDAVEKLAAAAALEIPQDFDPEVVIRDNRAKEGNRSRETAIKTEARELIAKIRGDRHV